MRQTTLLVLASLLFSIAACKEKTAVLVPPLQAKKPRAYESPVLEVPAAQMRDAFLGAYRLKPDSRILRAFAEIEQLLSGKPQTSLESKFVQGRWKILYDQQTVGDLPVYPDFNDYTKMLREWTLKSAQAHGSVIASESKTLPSRTLPFLMPASIEVLRELGSQWNPKKPDPVSLVEASRLMVALTIQSLDRLEIADLVPARTLAITVIAQVFTGDPMVREECLLAHAMGYSKHASVLSTKLPDSDPIKMFLDQRDDPLKQLALRSDASEEAKYLFLTRLAMKRDATAWSELASQLIPAEQASLSLLKTGLDVKRFELARISRYIQPMVVKQLLDSTKSKIDGLTSLNIGALTKQFEAELEKYKKQQTGRFWDGELSSAFFRGYFYSAADIEGRHYLDSLSSIEAAKEFHAQLGKNSSPVEEEFHLWYSTLLDAFEGKSNERVIVRDSSTFKAIGAPSLMRWFEQLKERLPVNGREFSMVARNLVQRMDSRLSHRLFLQQIAYSRLADLKLAEELCKSVVDFSAPESADAMQCAHFIGNDDFVLKILRSPKQDFSSRGDALYYLKRDHADRRVLKEAFEISIRLEPDSWSVRSQYVEFLRDGKDFAGAVATINDWLSKYGSDSSGFDAIHAHIRLSRTYNMMGKYEKAWAAIEPVVGSWQGTALIEAADVLDRLKRKDESKEFMNRAMERYPNSIETRISSAKILWRNAKYAEAAELFRLFKYPVPYDDWCSKVAPGFAEVFSKEKEETTLAALTSMLQAGIKTVNLVCVDNEIAKIGNKKLAFVIHDHLYQRGDMPTYGFLDGYRHLKETKGDQIALEWIRKQVPADRRNPYSIFALGGGEYSLLWDFVQEPNPADHLNVVWLFRAVAFVKQRGTDPHSEELMAYYNRPSNDFFHQLGRYLMGITSEAEILKLATTPSLRCEASYYIGVKAHGEGRYEDASDWYRISVETGEAKDLSFQYAYSTLYDWTHTGRGIWLAKKDKL